MNRSPLKRVAILLVACAFVLASGKSAVAELGCLHHGTHHGSAAHGVGDQGPGTHHGHGDSDDLQDSHAHAHSHAHGTGSDEEVVGDAETHEPGSADPHGSRCTCVGSCASVAGPATDRPGAVYSLPPDVADHLEVAPTAAAPLRSPTPRLLPFANAPPLSR